MYNTIIVEDDPMVTEVNRRFIEGHKSIRITETFKNGKTAFDYITKGNPVDLVILDIYMPEMSGFEFIRELRKSGNNCAVIPVTSANEPDSIKKITKYNVIDYLVKPFKQERLNMAIDKFIGYKKLIQNKEPTVSQAELDKIFNPQEQTIKPGKKIEPSTLNFITSYLKNHAGERLNVKTISASLNISPVTIRRYMDHLIINNAVERVTDFKTKGRPAAIYIYH